jgi:hypothetical protein
VADICADCYEPFLKANPTVSAVRFAPPEECVSPVHKRLREAEAKIAGLQVELANVPRHNKRGQGAHYASRIQELSDEHLDILDVLGIWDCRSYAQGRPLAANPEQKGVTELVNEYRSSRGRKILRSQTVSGRLSELQGLKRVSCLPTEVELKDPLHYQFRSPSTPLWYLNPQELVQEPGRNGLIASPVMTVADHET